MNVRFCPSCRSLILTDFRFCPFCGAEIKGPELSEALEEPFGRMQARAASAGAAAKGSVALDAAGIGGDPTSALAGPAYAASRDIFAVAARELEQIEADMELIIQELEREGRSSS